MLKATGPGQVWSWDITDLRTPWRGVAFRWEVMALIPIDSPGVPLYRGTPGSPLVVLVHDYYGRLPALERFANDAAQRRGHHSGIL